MSDVPTANSDAVDASVIICAYTEERWRELASALSSVLAQTARPRQVILVVDNNEALLQRAQAAFRDVLVVANHHGPGLSGGRNTGFDHAVGSILAFLDDDAVAESQWLAALVEGLGDRSVLGAGGPVLPLWSERPPAWATEEFNWVFGCTWTGMASGDGAAIRNPIGANFAVRRSVFGAVGGFAQELGRRDVRGKTVTGTADETEFCIRAVRRFPGGTFRFLTEARVHHVVPPGRATFAYFRRRCRLEGTSKAVLTTLAGTEQGLASERSYVVSVLPRGVLRELTRRDRAGTMRAAAMVGGAAITAAAYLEGRVAGALGRLSRYST